MRMRRAVVAACLAAAVLAPSALASDSSTATTQVGDVARLGDHTVRVIVKAPGDLTGAQVQASLGGKLAFVESVKRSGPHTPLHLVFAVDTSGSMSGLPITAAIAAGQRLLDSIGTDDQVGLVVFDSSARVVAPMTSNVAAVRSALSSLTTSSGTALYDGVATAAKLAGRDPAANRVVVVLSDGADTSSNLKLAALEQHGVTLPKSFFTSETGAKVDVMRRGQRKSA
jgi:tight adherence protein B